MISILFSLVVAASPHCGVERAAIKNLLDSDVATIQFAPVPKTVEDLIKLVPPDKWTPDLPRLPAEFETVAVEVDVVGSKLEADLDLHVVVRGASGQTMIAEFPSALCVAKAPEPYRSQMITARRAFIHAFGTVTAKFRTLTKPLHAKITALIFYDKLHGQTGVAKNGAELHPVLLFEAL